MSTPEPGPAFGRLILVGHGKMGAALLAGWQRVGLARRYDVVEPAPVKPQPGHAVNVYDDGAELPRDPPADALVVAVKPQVLEPVLTGYRHFVGPETVFVSIAAGKTLADFERVLGPAAIVRTMPNTPAAIGQGVTVLCANAACTPAQRVAAERLLQAAGTTLVVDDEGLIDAVTAVSGGGPAYVFLLIETLAEAGRKAGLPDDMAMVLARETVIGSGALAGNSPEPAATLRRNVTSPKGTTEAALEVLMDPSGLQPLFDAAIAAATQRSRELSR